MTSNRPLSQLIYARVQDVPASPRLITLHKYNQFAPDVKDYALAAAAGARIIGLESYKGVFVGKEIVGYTWFIGPQDRPSPLFFGDALAEIERFLWDEVDRQETGTPELPTLIGVEQGGIMALAAALAAPDLLSGVIAVEAFLPIVPGWEPPLAPLDNLPILLLDSPESARPREGVLAGEALAGQLRDWGADVERREIAAGGIPGAEMASWMARYEPRHLHPKTAASGTMS